MKKKGGFTCPKCSMSAWRTLHKGEQWQCRWCGCTAATKEYSAKLKVETEPYSYETSTTPLIPEVCADKTIPENISVDGEVGSAGGSIK